MASLLHLQNKSRAISFSPKGPLLTAVMTRFQAVWHSSHHKKQEGITGGRDPTQAENSTLDT